MSVQCLKLFAIYFEINLGEPSMNNLFASFNDSFEMSKDFLERLSKSPSKTLEASLNLLKGLQMFLSVLLIKLSTISANISSLRSAGNCRGPVRFQLDLEEAHLQAN